MSTLPKSMRVMAITAQNADTPAFLQQAQRTLPVAQPHEVLIKTAYAGINSADLFQVAGSYSAPDDAPADIPGLEISGAVVACGKQVTRWQVGDTVCALLGGGGYSEYVAVPAAQCLPIPSGLSLAQAASLPECWATVWMALIQQAALAPRERILIHGGSSGIGIAAIQLARWRGAETIFTTAGNAEKCALCHTLGATAINYKEQDFVTVIKDATHGRGIDVVLDMVGGDYIGRNMRAMAPGGRMVSLAFLQGADIQLRAGALLMKQLSWSGMTLRNQSAASKANIIEQLQLNIWPLLADKSIIPILDGIVPFAAITQAHARMDKYLHSGKIVVEVGA